MMKTVNPTGYWVEGGKTLGATERYRARNPRSVASGRKRLVCSPVWEIFRRFGHANLLKISHTGEHTSLFLPDATERGIRAR